MATLEELYTNAFGEPTRNLFESREYFNAGPEQQKLAYEQALSAGRVDPNSVGLSVDQRVAAKENLAGQANALKLGREQKGLDMAAELYQSGYTNPHEVQKLVHQVTGVDILKTTRPFDFSKAARGREAAVQGNAMKMLDYYTQFMPPERAQAEVRRLTGVNVGGMAGPGAIKREEGVRGLAKTAAETAGTQARTVETEVDTAKKQQDLRSAPVTEYRQVENVMDSLNRMDRMASSIRDDPHLWRIAGPVAGKYVPTLLPGSSDVEQRLKALKAQVAKNTLQEIRDASKTGGALGNVSDKDIQLLESAIASLELTQSPAQLRQSMDEVMHYTNQVREKAGRGYADTYGAAGAARVLPAAARNQLESYGEGVPAKFKNGQVWMLNRGVPTRVR